MNKKQFTTEVLEAEKSLYHIAKSILKNDEDCADAIQNAVLHAFEKLHTLRNERYFKTWLTRILINECNHIIRSRKEQIPYEDYYEAQSVTQQENNPEVFEAVMELEDNYRIPFVLFYVEGFSIKEICQILKLSQGTVKTRLYRGRKLLKERLVGVYGYEK
ncbi:MAG TPA: RNA polymerase subunit sigma [Lachnospiraceae bacterium]|nr:RNA polymerase subunit sigma [Lachnospiraceae bacterium]